MNTKNTASQPKVASIGDDAQFQKLLVNYTLAVRAGEDGVKPYAAMVTYIENFRAPADQAASEGE